MTHNSENMTDVHEEDSDIDTDKFVSSDGQDLMSMLQNDLKSHGYGEQEE